MERDNILTRSIIIYGQGAIRCHPYMLPEMLAASHPDQEQALKDFDKAVFSYVDFAIGISIHADSALNDYMFSPALQAELAALARKQGLATIQQTRRFGAS